jgi:hypothetical protein
MNRPHARDAWIAWAALACIAVRLTWRLVRLHLRRMRTLVPPIALLLCGAFHCLTTHRFGVSDAAVLMLPGDLGPASRGTAQLLLFWVLSYALLPLQVVGLHEVSTRGHLVERLRPLALRGPGRRNLRYAAAALAVLALLGIGKILLGSKAQGLVVQAPDTLLAFFVVNWLLLHLLLTIVTLTTTFFVACGAAAPCGRETPEHRLHHADSRHAPG